MSKKVFRLFVFSSFPCLLLVLVDCTDDEEGLSDVGLALV
jgi:hypothetical protein